jgi:elongation factor Ts
MAITAALVKELRERTGAGMMDCKKALQQTEGDIDKAIEEMRKRGQAKAEKKAGRTAAEGLLVAMTSADNKQGVLLEVNSETDFVARDDHFVSFVNHLAHLALQHNIKDAESLLNSTDSDSGETVEQMRQALVAKLGENIRVRRLMNIITAGHVGCYVHGGRVGALVAMQGGDAALGKDLAMHVAAQSPLVVEPEQVPQEIVAKEKSIVTEQAKESGKPENIVEKMVEGRMRKFLQEVSLVGQAFIKDTDMSIKELLKQHSAEVDDFVRLEVGEGIEKQESNFVEEVMAQTKG